MLFVFCLNLNAQKPRKTFNYLQENQLTLAVEEYNKISRDKDYDNEDKVLFAYAKCLFQIDTNYQKYNPTQAIKEFNGTYILSDIKESVYKFLGKYTLSPEVINQKIINEIYREAIKLNSIEVYKNALNYCSFQYLEDINNRLENLMYHHIKLTGNINQLKEFTIRYPKSIFYNEIQILLERNTFKYYKSINNIDSLNQFISQFKFSDFKIEAVDYRDSIVLTNVPDEYDSIYTFIIKYPESRYNKELILKLPDLLFNKSIGDNTTLSLKKFVDTYPNDSRVELINEKISEINFSNISIQKKINLEIEIHGFKEGLALAKFNDKYGFIDTTMKIVVPIIYDFLQEFSEGLNIVKINDKLGIVNKTGQVVIPIIYDEIDTISDGFLKVNLNGKYGLINKTGQELIPCVYDNIDEFSETLFSVTLTQKIGFINKLGKVVTPPIYNHVSILGESEFQKYNMAQVMINRETGCIDKNSGEVVIPIMYRNIDLLPDDGLLNVSSNSTTNYWRWGYLDMKGRTLIPLIYVGNSKFSDGLARVNLDGNYGYINKTGQVVIPFGIYDYAFPFSDGLAKVKKNGKFGFINKTGKVVIPFIYNNNNDNSISEFSDGLAEVRKNGNSGYINKTGKVVIPLIYDEISKFSDGLAKVKKNGKYGFINKTGKVVISIVYDFIDSFSDGIARIYLNGKIGLIDKSGKEVAPIIYNEILINEYFNKIVNGVRVNLNGKIGILDKSGKIILPIIYDRVELQYKEWESHTHAEIFLNNKKGIIDLTGKVLIPAEFDDVDYFIKEGLAKVQINGKMGVINKAGKEILPIIYSQIFISEGYAVATRFDKSVFLKLNNNISNFH
jgi:hypothetical protein